MKTLEKLYDDLEQYSDFEKEDNPEKFLETVDKIILLKDPNSIKILLKYFDDNSEYNWAFESLKVALDAYSDEVHAKAVIEEIPFMLNRAPKWLLGLIYRILNHPSSLSCFKRSMHLISKESMIQLLNLVEQGSPYHKELCAELKKELSQLP